MRTTASQRERFDLAAVDRATASAMHDAQVPGSGQRSRRPERWLVDLVVLALAGVLLMAAALAGLGAASTSVPLPPAASGFMGGHPANAEALDLRGSPVCCHETQ
jgi:hypothetical protein